MGKTKKTKILTTDADTVDLDPKLLTLDPDVQPREKVTQTLVTQYAEDMRAGDVFPPVVAFTDGETHWVADGFHRVDAAIRAGLMEIRVEVHVGGKRDAVLHAVGSNAIHGLRRTNKDKRRAVTTLLEDPEWSQWPAREIARQCRVSNTFVSKLKKDLSVNDAQMDGTSLVTRGGKTFPMDTTNIGRGGSIDGGPSNEDGDHGDDAPGSGSADLDELDGQPDDPNDPNDLNEEINDPSDTQDSASDPGDDLVGALDDILSEVREGGGDEDDGDGDDSEDGAGAADEGDDEVVPDEDDVPGDEGDDGTDEPDDIGDPSATTDPDDNYPSTSEPASPPDTTTSSSPGRWALVTVSGAKLDDEQAATVRKQLGDASYTHVLVVKEGSGTAAYPAFQRACEMVQKAGFPTLFHGRLLVGEKALTYAAVACRDGEGDATVDLLQQVLGGGMVEMEEAVRRRRAPMDR